MPARCNLPNGATFLAGAGFSGFWYHLGLFQSIPSLHDYDYYCYSSGCLSLVLGFIGASVQDTYDVARDIQISWSTSKLSSYDIVDEFIERLLPTDEATFAKLLPRLNVISTSLETGVEIQSPSNRTELVALLHRTTRIPLLTGSTWIEQGNQRYIDGRGAEKFSFSCWAYSLRLTPAFFFEYQHRRFL